MIREGVYLIKSHNSQKQKGLPEGLHVKDLLGSSIKQNEDSPTKLSK